MNYRVYDLRNSFTLEEASLAWVGQDQVERYGVGKSETVLRALIEEAKAGGLPVEEVFTEDSGTLLTTIKGGEVIWRECVVSRGNLIAFAKEHDQHPKFLFPEQREYGEGIPTLEKKRKLQPRQIDCLTVKAVAQTLWDEDPNWSIDRLVHHQAIREYGNGRHYTEKTVRAWLSEVDPRDDSNKPGPAKLRK